MEECLVVARACVCASVCVSTGTCRRDVVRDPESWCDDAG